MKKILLLLLLLPYFLVAQTSTGQEQEFDYGIKNNASQTVTTADYLTTTGTDGTQGKILPANLPVSTAQQTAIDAKVADFINDNATTIAPSQNAVYDALQLKQTVFTGISQSQFLTENDIVIDNTARTLTIATVKNGEAISGSNPVEFFTDGNGVSLKHTKTSPVVFSFTDTTGVWYFYFNSSGTAIASQTAPADASTIAMVYRIYWNAALATADKRVIESIEVYKNDGSWIDREWKNTQGAQYASGLNISSNVIASGTPAVDGSNAVINLSSGTIIDNNFSYTLTNASSGTTKFTQDLGSGLLPATSGKFITITNNASLVLDKIPATDFPFLWNSGTNTPEYLTQLGVRTAVTNNYFFVYYVYALQDPRRGETIKIKSAEIDFANATLAEAHTWAQLQNLFPTLKDSKIRLLYKLTFEYKSSYDVGTKKSALRKVDDLRKQRITTSATVGGTIPASIVTFSPSGNIAYTNVQLAIEELDTEKSSTLQDGYLKSATPQITTTATLGSVDIQRGSAADTDKIFRVLNGAGAETFGVTGDGNTSVSNLILKENPVGSTPYKLSQDMGVSDDWAIYGEALEGDKSSMVFELGDNGSPFDPMGQKFSFRYNASATGTPKTPFEIDYDKVNSFVNIGVGISNPQGRVHSYSESNTEIIIDAPLGSSILTMTSTTGGAGVFGFQNNLRFGTVTGFGASGFSEIAKFNSAGIFKLNNLAGTGDRVVSANTSGELIISTAPTAPTATAGTNTTQIATTAFVQTAIGNYKKYVALISQTGTNAPTATVLENTLGGAISWAYTSVGLYTGTLTGAFVAAKTIGFTNVTVDADETSGFVRLSDNQVELRTRLGGVLTDGIFQGGNIEIRVYN